MWRRQTGAPQTMPRGRRGRAPGPAPAEPAPASPRSRPEGLVQVLARELDQDSLALVARWEALGRPEIPLGPGIGVVDLARYLGHQMDEAFAERKEVVRARLAERENQHRRA